MTAGRFTLHSNTTVTQLTGQLFLVLDDGSRRLVKEGDVLAQGAVVLSLDGTTFMANGQRFELVSAQLDVMKDGEGSLHRAAEHIGVQASGQSTLTLKTLSNEIGELQDEILKDINSTGDARVAAVGGENVSGVLGGSSNDGYVTIARDGDATIATAGFETRNLADPLMTSAFYQDDARGVIDVTTPNIWFNPLDSNDTTPMISGHTDVAPGTTVTIVVTDANGNQQTLTSTVQPDGSFTVEVVTPLPEGDYKVDASVTDLAGNKVDTTASGTIDATAPSINVDVPDHTNDTTPTITGTTDAAAGTTVTIVVTDSAGNKQDLTTTVKPDGSYSVDVITPLPEGGFTADATIIDPAGNQAGASGDGIVDTTPSVGLTIVLDPNITPDDVINAAEASQDIPVSGTVSGEFNPGDTVTLTVNGKLFTGQVDANGKFTIEVAGRELVADPDHIIDASVTSTDAAGNSSTVTTTEGYGVDTTLPTITVDVPLNTNDTTPTITGTSDAAAGTTVTIVVTDSVGISQTLTTTVQADGRYSVDVITPLPEGGFTADATIIDPAGNQAGASGDGIVDTTPPVGLTIVLDPNITPDDVINAAESGGNIPVSGTVDGEFKIGDTVTLTVNGKEFTGKVLGTDGRFTIDVPGSELVADPDHIIDA
ncbi:MAG: retention module-containing protein, partial [Aeromonas sp.]